MIRFTLDTNAIIGLENAEPATAALRRIVEAFRGNRISLAVPTIAASEHQRSGRHLEHFDEFRERLRNLGLEGVDLIHPIAYWNISFYGMGYLPDDAMIGLERRIHAILHPDIEFDIASFCAARGLPVDTETPPKTWRNAKCDVQAMWTHIHHKREVFVTNDRNFLKATKRPLLIELGAGEIVTPEAAVAMIDAAV